MRSYRYLRAEIELNNLVLKNNAHPCAMTPVCAILSKTKRRYGVEMNHLFPDILPVFCSSTFSWLWSLGRVLFLSRLSGLVWVDAFLVEWIAFSQPLCFHVLHKHTILAYCSVLYFNFLVHIAWIRTNHAEIRVLYPILFYCERSELLIRQVYQFELGCIKKIAH